MWFRQTTLREECPLSWTTTTATAAGSQTMTSTSTAGTGGTITASYGTVGSYNFPAGTTYGDQDMTSSGGSVYLATYESTGTVNGSTGGFSYIDIKFPAGATGPITFTISGIDSYTTTANGKGAQYFTDNVGVFSGASAGSGGTAVQPVSTSSATYNSTTGFTTATGTTAGSATYTISSIPSNGIIEIRLSNAYSGTIPSGAHPNQSVLISSVTCGTAPTTTLKMGVFDTVKAYGYDSGHGGIDMSFSAGYYTGTMTPADQNWSDATGYPTANATINNLSGSYTPGGTSGTTGGYYGSGLWISSPTDASGNALTGTTTLLAGAKAKYCVKVVYANSSVATSAGAPSGWNSTTTLSALVGGSNTQPPRVAQNGVSETLSWSSWTTTTNADGTVTGQGCVTLTTNADLSVSNSGSTVQYNQLTLSPNLTYSTDGLAANDLLLVCTTTSFVSGTLQTTVGGTTTAQATNFPTTTSFVREPGYTGTC